MIINYREIEGNEYGFPRWLMERLECPSAGEGVHRWIYRAALALRHYVEIDEAIEIIQEHMTRDENPVGEVLRSCESAYEAESHGLPPEAFTREEYPANPKEVERIYRYWKEMSEAEEKRNSLTMLRDVSNPIPNIVGVLNALYSDDDLLCVGNVIIDKQGKKHGYTANTLAKKHLIQADDLNTFSQIVPNPMSKEWGYTKAGEESVRSVDNAAVLRTYAVTDFDFTLEGKFGGVIQRVMDEVHEMPREVIHEITAALILDIAMNSPGVPLVMVVDSGGKSLHAWWDIRHMNCGEQYKWFMPLVPLGADPAIFLTNNQYVRLPWGTREVHHMQQPVIFWGL